MLEEKFLLFIWGLEPKIREQVEYHMEGNVTRAMLMAEKMDVWQHTGNEGGKIQDKGKTGTEGKNKKTQNEQVWGERHTFCECS